MRYLAILLILSSCSATWHVNRALKKDPNIIKPDTIVETVYGDTSGIDSAEVSLPNLWIKATGKGRIDLRYRLIDTTSVVSVPDTPRTERVKARQKGKTDRKKIKEDAKTDRVKIKYVYKTVKVKENVDDRLRMGIAIGLSISVLLVILYKRFFR